ncbi:calcium/calmodulin-regulated receptor-like kinase 1 [Bidens hawaiensis]|uniref:calcium/calmodulin-regulated receptor-like kinase 1 n=1 Tax=Bidens hawaiensis TaxID=980011 RepID=UPI0040491321
MALITDSEHLRISLQDIKIATNNFTTLIGKGGYGYVYKGELSLLGKLTTIAVKRLDAHFGQGLKEFLKEIHFLSRYKHENLVLLLGFCEEENEKILVYEHAEHGSFDTFLRMDSTLCPLTCKQKIEICIDAACGLDYLHNQVAENYRIIHRDIKSANILLDHSWKAMIADFGLATIGRANEIDTFLITNVCGTPGYVDPKYIDTGILTKESDVYSFGVVLFEVLCGKLCFMNVNDKQKMLAPLVKSYYEKGNLHEIIDPSMKQQLHSNSLNKIAKIGYQCLLNDREKRPQMGLVLKNLKEALEVQHSTADSSQEDSEAEDSTICYFLLPKSVKARNIFGEPIRNNTMVQMRLAPTRENKAQVAYKMMNKGNKYDNALRFVKDLKAQWGNGITTLCLLYNATGETMTYTTSRNWFGDIGPSPYPTIILNGQWGAYLHTKTPQAPSGSAAAVVYRGKYTDNAFCDRMITWSIPWQRFTQDNAAYCEIKEVGQFDGAVWDAIYNRTPYAGRESSATWKECYTRVTVESDTSPIYKAIFTRVDAVVTFV